MGKRASPALLDVVPWSKRPRSPAPRLAWLIENEATRDQVVDLLALPCSSGTNDTSHLAEVGDFFWGLRLAVTRRCWD